MNIKAELLKEHSKAQATRIAEYVAKKPERFKNLMELFFSATYRVTQRAAWPVGICAEKHPHLIRPYLGQMIDNLSGGVHDAVKRNTVRALQNIKIPDELLGEAANNCFALLESNKEPIAIKVFSMTVLANICEKEPDLGQELKLVIENQLPYGSAGFKSRAKKVLSKIKTLKNSK